MLKFMLTLLFIASVSPVFAGPSVEEIIKKANIAAYYSGNDGRAQVDMVITDSQGRTRQRQFTILRKDKEDGGQQLFYVYFKKPSDVRKMVFMVHKNIERDDDRWLYLPALSLVKRIAASDKRTSFVGSHFFYEDVSGRSPAEDKHELLEETEKYYILNNIPKNVDNVEFSSYKVWVNKNTFLPEKAEYTDKAHSKYRLVEATKIENIDGFPTVTESKVTDLTNGGFTISNFSKVKYNIGLTDKIFTERYLHRPPREAR